MTPARLWLCFAAYSLLMAGYAAPGAGVLGLYACLFMAWRTRNRLAADTLGG
jgi:hypothetical protein